MKVWAKKGTILPRAEGQRLDGERRGGRSARRTKGYEVLDGAPFGFPNPLPAHRGGRGKLNNGNGRANWKMAGVANGTAVIGVAMFVGCGDSLHAHNAGQQQRYKKRSPPPAICEHTNHVS